jgi:glycosyltransferase involved in cell wall biosynthesis
VHAVEEAAFIGIILRRTLGIPFVYDMDSSLAEQLIGRYAWLRSAEPLLKWFERRAVRESVGVLAVCKALEELALGYAPGHFVRRAEDLTLLANDGQGAEDLREIAGANARIVLYVGNLEPYQGIDLLVAGFRHTLDRVPDAHLVVIGGSDKAIQHYRRLAESLGIDDHTHLIGPRSPDLLSGYLRQASVLVSPRSMGLNTPMKVYSYLDSGRPLVATRLPTHTQVLDDDIACLAEPEPQALGEAITRVLSDPEFAERLASRAKHRAQCEFTPDAFRGKVVRFYEPVVSQAVALRASRERGRRGGSRL